MSEPTSPTTDHTWRFEKSSVIISETFYAQLKLAPLLRVSKAIRSLNLQFTRCRRWSAGVSTPMRPPRWRQFRQAFESSGLSKTHRGIIAGLARNRSSLNLPAEYDQFLICISPDLVHSVCSVYLVYLVYLVCLVYLVEQGQLDEPETR
jgi:hypothetical protein